VLEGAIQRGFARDASVVPLERTDGKARMLVVGPKTADSVRQWLADGVSWGDVLTRIHAAG
jgi:hypothetical protein